MKYTLVVLLLFTAADNAAARSTATQDWPMFGGNLESSSSNPAPTGITADNVNHLTRHQVSLDGTVDASAIFLQGVMVRGAPHDTIFVTTTYGKTIAVDAAGLVLWEYTPDSYKSLAGSRQVANTTPVADSDRQFIYAASPDGYIEKLAVSDGRLVWRTSVTRLPLREKMGSPLKFVDGHVIVVTAGYIGDRPPYQGHVAILDGKSGKLLKVWNSLCSNRSDLLEPESCPQTQSAIWGRAGAVVDSHTGSILVATGNGQWDGSTNWGDALIELDRGATGVIGNYTPVNTEDLNARDLDLGSASPVLLGGDLIAQGGKDGKIRLLSKAAIAGSTPHKGGELQIVSTPSGTDLFSQPAVWEHDGHAWMFAADNGGTAAWEVENSKLQEKWRNTTGGTSPFEAGGLLFVYARGGGLNVYDAVSGKRITVLPCGPGHWNSPIVVPGKIVLPEGNANDRESRGVLDVWSLPGGPQQKAKGD